MHPKESTVESCKDAFKGKDIARCACACAATLTYYYE